jgi:hypothetical protein
MPRDQWEHLVLQVAKQTQVKMTSTKMTKEEEMEETRMKFEDLWHNDIDGGPGLFALGLKLGHWSIPGSIYVEFFFEQKWKRNIGTEDDKCGIPAIHSSIASRIPLHHNLPQDSNQYTYLPLSEQVVPIPEPQRHFFMNQMLDLSICIQFDRVPEAICFCFQIICNYGFHRHSEIFHVYGMLGTLLAQVDCPRPLVMSCIDEMWKLSRDFPSHRLNCLYYQQMVHAHFRNTKMESVCFAKISACLPAFSDLFGDSFDVHVLTKMKTLEDALMAARCSLVRKETQIDAEEVDEKVLDKLEMKVSKLEKLLRSCASQGRNCKQHLAMTRLYRSCLYKLKHPDRSNNVQDVHLDDSMQFFLKLYNDRRNYLMDEYKYDMQEWRIGLEGKAHRFILETWATSLVSHGVLVAQDCKQGRIPRMLR